MDPADAGAVDPAACAEPWTDRDILDPLARSAVVSVRTKAGVTPGSSGASFAPIPSKPHDPVDPVVAAGRVSLEHVIAQVVRRVAWSGDGRAGSVRLELGAGALAGATIVVHVDDSSQVTVAMTVPAGIDRDAWRERLAKRLEIRGLQVVSLDVA